ncbi:hypothetical protein WP1_265 [Pseudomonas phage WP1]
MVIFDEQKFRTLFPELADPESYPAMRLQLYFDIPCEFIPDRDSPYRILNGKALEGLPVFPDGPPPFAVDDASSGRGRWRGHSRWDPRRFHH